MVDIRIGADTTEFENKLAEVEDEARSSLQAIATNIRRTAEIGLFFAQASGIAIDQVLQLYIETGLRTLEFIVAAEAATTAGTLGLATIGRLGLQAGAVALMFAQINALRNQKAELAQRLGFATSGLRALTFYFVTTSVVIFAMILGFVVVHEIRRRLK